MQPAAASVVRGGVGIVRSQNAWLAAELATTDGPLQANVTMALLQQAWASVDNQARPGPQAQKVLVTASSIRCPSPDFTASQVRWVLGMQVEHDPASLDESEMTLRCDLSLLAEYADP